MPQTAADKAITQWSEFATPQPWGLAFDEATGTFAITARLPDNRPRCGPDGHPIVIASGLSHADAMLIVTWRNALDGETQRNIVDLF